MSTFVRVTLAILRKDLRRELRTKETISSMFVFVSFVFLDTTPKTSRQKTNRPLHVLNHEHVLD